MPEIPGYIPKNTVDTLATERMESVELYHELEKLIQRIETAPQLTEIERRKGVAILRGRLEGKNQMEVGRDMGYDSPSVIMEAIKQLNKKLPDYAHVWRALTGHWKDVD